MVKMTKNLLFTSQYLLHSFFLPIVFKSRASDETNNVQFSATMLNFANCSGVIFYIDRFRNQRGVNVLLFKRTFKQWNGPLGGSKLTCVSAS